MGNTFVAARSWEENVGKKLSLEDLKRKQKMRRGDVEGARDELRPENVYRRRRQEACEWSAASGGATGKRKRRRRSAYPCDVFPVRQACAAFQTRGAVIPRRLRRRPPLQPAAPLSHRVQ